jgi:3-hydroxyisobutyrate dehydrogenase-like beta-hydroxyacid dehydrogenase
MLLADGMGLPRRKVEEALLQTPNISPTARMKLSNYVKNEFPLLFTVANMRKDVGLALAEMNNTHKQLPLLAQTEAVFGKANEDILLSKEDFSAIIKEVEKK